jgi:hypothetical protein
VPLAARRLGEQYRDRPDSKGLLLLPQPFTLRQLRSLHPAVAGVDVGELKPDGFRRLMEPRLHDTGRTTERLVGRPTALYGAAPTVRATEARSSLIDTARLAAEGRTFGGAPPPTPCRLCETDPLGPGNCAL